MQIDDIGQMTSYIYKKNLNHVEGKRGFKWIFQKIMEFCLCDNLLQQATIDSKAIEVQPTNFDL